VTVDVGTELALLVDVGSAWVKAGVVGRSRGRWRIVAHASQPTAWGGAELRRRLVEQLEAIGDSRLAGRYDDLIAGANRIECHTARDVGRIALVAVSRELSGAAARRAAEAAGWEVAEAVTLDDGRSLADRLARLQSADVDAWLLAGGFDDAGSPRALEAAGLVAAARLVDGGPVVWAGATRLADAVASLFEADAVTTVANPRPTPHREDGAALRDHLARLLRDTVAREDQANLAATTFPRAAASIAASGGLRVLAVDLGARSAIRALAEPDGSVASRLHAGGGLAGIAHVAGAAGRVSRLAGDAGDEAAMADLIQTIRARPATLPQVEDELAGLYAAVPVLLSAMVADDPTGPVDLLIGAGRTIAGARPGAAARMLLDGIRPLGVTQLAVDAASILGPLGSLAGDELREGLELLGDDALAPLGTAVVSRGGSPGQVAMRVTIHRAGWPTPAPLDVRIGQVVVVPLARGLEAELVIEPGHGVSLGTGRRSPRVTARAMGGSVGIVMDARGVPIALPRRADDRRAVLAGWGDAFAREGEASG
jgi:hypothetical protein